MAVDTQCVNRHMWFRCSWCLHQLGFRRRRCNSLCTAAGRCGTHKAMDWSKVVLVVIIEMHVNLMWSEWEMVTWPGAIRRLWTQIWSLRRMLAIQALRSSTLCCSWESNLMTYITESVESTVLSWYSIYRPLACLLDQTKFELTDTEGDGFTRSCLRCH